MITVADILVAQQRIEPFVWQTPLVESSALSCIASASIRLKLECWQRTGSFKVRGALAKLSILLPEQVARGVVTASAGNHGLGVAYAGQALGQPPATIFVPENAPISKVDHLRTFDCVIRQEGADYDTTHAIAKAHAQRHGALYISAYDDPVVIAGQGTVGLEILRDLPIVDLILVPVGGGGLIAGIATAAKAIKPSVRVIGVQPEASPAALLSLRDGCAYETYPAGPTICDGLAGGFGRVPFKESGDLIDGIIVVPESDVRDAVRWLATKEQMIVEGSGAIAIAPLLNGQVAAAGQNIVAVLTGRNLDVRLLQEILSECPDQKRVSGRS